MRPEIEIFETLPLFPNIVEPDGRVGMKTWQVDSHNLWSDTVPSGLRDGNYNFVLNEQRQLVIGILPMGIGGDDHVGHPVLAKFQSVYSAGDFIMQDGIIVEIRDSSGHYRTGIEGLRAAKLAFQLFKAPLHADCKYTPYAQRVSRRS